MLCSVARRASTSVRLTRALCTSGKLPVNGVDLFVRQNGGTGLPIVCMPGAMGTADTDFGPQLRDLADQFQMVSFDPRGYGSSQPPARDFPLDFYERDADDAAALMASLGHSKYAVMGWSDGAISAVHHAARHPDKVDRLVMFGASAYMSQEDLDASEAIRDVEATWSQRQKDGLYPIYGAEGMQKLWGGCIDAWTAISKKTETGSLCMEAAKAVTCPTLILHGAKDPICLADHPQWFKANMPNVEALHILENGKHNLHLRYADEVNALVREFCAKSPLA